MPRRLIPFLADSAPFPSPTEAHRSGLLAVTRGLGADRIVQAYRTGIFPWHSDEHGVHWFSPDPRAAIIPPSLHIPHSLLRTLRKASFEIRADTDFAAVMTSCAAAPRDGQDGTWITPDFIRAYTDLHARGLAHSVEAWQEGRLVGGLYGVSLGACFFGESMFTRTPDAAKVAFVHLAAHLFAAGFELIDCQQYTHHMARFGAIPFPRSRFLELLQAALVQPTRQGAWTDWFRQRPPQRFSPPASSSAPT